MEKRLWGASNAGSEVQENVCSSTACLALARPQTETWTRFRYFPSMLEQVLFDFRRTASYYPPP
jgi:hypothetical protein